jgi:hypothetical protein
LESVNAQIPDIYRASSICGLRDSNEAVKKWKEHAIDLKSRFSTNYPEELKITTYDKLERLKKQISFVSKFMDYFKK